MSQSVLPPEQSFLSPEPEVILVNAFREPFKGAVAVARTCYSAKGIIREEDVREDQYKIGESIYQAGHHTNFQHAHFQFALSNVSRQFIWSFLHSHPFYNSEQVSQRYVAVKPGNYVIPPIQGEALKLYQQTADRQMEAYHQLSELLEIPVTEAYFQRFPQRQKQADEYKKSIQKKTQEIARYVLPIGTFAYLHHTISGITLMRYYRLCRQLDIPLEQTIVVTKMVTELLKLDPLYQSILEEPLPPEAMPEYPFLAGGNLSPDTSVHEEFIREFDESLEGYSSRLIDWKQNQEKVLAQSVREVLGVPESYLPDQEAIELALNPGKNKLLGETLNLTTLSKLSRCLNHVSYSFRKKISHSADSQDQRHRMTPASRPILTNHLLKEPDYYLPELIKQSPEALNLYREIMDSSWEAVHSLRKMGVSNEFAMYLLPNSVNIRFTESADLLNLRHKHIMRLCYNAQDEIWRASLEEMKQIREINPVIGSFLRPPCNQRKWAGHPPYCPEGERYCGVPVWQMSPADYQRVI